MQKINPIKASSDILLAIDTTTIIAITDHKGTITYANEKFCEISKHDQEELIGQNHRILNSNHHSKDFFKVLWKTIAQGNVWTGEIRNRAKDGTFYWVHTTIVPYLNKNGQPYQYVAIRTDITDRKQTEEDLKSTLVKLGDSNQELSDIKHALDESSILARTDHKGTITYANEKFCEISKYDQEELIGQNHRILNSNYHSKDFFKVLWKTIAHGNVWTGEIRNSAKDGTFYWVHTTIVPFLNEYGQPYQYVAIRHDITDKKMPKNY
ncbi:PAS domain-containing protein [Salipaludibacillus sp. CF4.18]|uniref:PAS domain-containing protein n=1 Tax=Salipaludibacillus sp. CF4.18 TaxID=3373081 RepID=UPI003EE5CC34